MVFLKLYKIYNFSAYYPKDDALKPPNKCVTPYGGRLEWELPGKHKLFVHLKDKDKIRPKKRWSQVRKIIVFTDCYLSPKIDCMKRIYFVYQEQDYYLRIFPSYIAKLTT